MVIQKEKRFFVVIGLFLVVAAALIPIVKAATRRYAVSHIGAPDQTAPVPKIERQPSAFKPAKKIDIAGLSQILPAIKPWETGAPEEVRAAFENAGPRAIAMLDEIERTYPPPAPPDIRVQLMIGKASIHLYDAEATKAIAILDEARRVVESDPKLAAEWLYTLYFVEGVACLRQGEDENCIACRGEGSCIYPVRPTGIHKNRAGSEAAKSWFLKYLERFPDDAAALWLLNLACMTLGEHPQGVPSQYLIPSDRFGVEMDIGRFRDIAPLVGVDQFGMAGGAIMDDFDNDGLLDLFVTDWGAGAHMSFYRNNGKGTFDDRTEDAGLLKQYGGLNVSQADIDNDGNLDVFVSRGAWMPYPVQQALLRNEGKGKFTNITEKAGLTALSSTNCGAWADYDNDGWIDLFVCNEVGPNRLYHNRRDGTFEEVAAAAGLVCPVKFCKGATWLDYDGDGYPDLFLSNNNTRAQLYHNNGNGTFTEVTDDLGITGPRGGFTCWAWDYDNDGWPDIFATCYQRSLADFALDFQGKPTRQNLDRTRLFRNLGGKRFEDVSEPTGVNHIFVTMAANFGDFDNDGFLDFYLGTGEPSIATLVPKRMFKNVAGQRFAEITQTAGVGHLQKGHGIAIGDWDRDGNMDIFFKIGGAVPGDQFHSALFQNPGHDNNWVTVKLVGKQTNRAAIGARIKVVTDSNPPLTVYRHVGYGSSFGGNPLEQTIGLAKCGKIKRLEVLWPTSRTTQVFENVAVNQGIEITEFAADYRRVAWPKITVPKE